MGCVVPGFSGGKIEGYGAQQEHDVAYDQTQWKDFQTRQMRLNVKYPLNYENCENLVEIYG